MQYPELPPLFDLKPLSPGEDPFDVASAAAQAGDAGAGDVFWSQRLDRIELAVVLEPDNPVRDSLMMLPLAMVAFGDALGAIGPPVLAVHFRWPDAVEVNGGFVGGFRIAMAEVANDDEVPDWLVVSFSIAVQMDLMDDAPGQRADETTLYDEGCGEITVDDLTESFARHFLTWINRWQEEGFEPVRLAWLVRLKQPEAGAGEDAAPKLNLDALGGLLCEGSETRALSEALQGPSWIAR